jgi:hypothetical protein
MEQFYMWVSIIAVILLIIVLTMIGVVMTNVGPIVRTAAWPPTSGVCPDYWQLATDGSCNIPSSGSATVNRPSNDTVNTWSLDVTDKTKVYVPGYSQSAQAINFNDGGWNNLATTAICAKRKWALSNGIEWDGVSNYPNC